MPGKRPGGQPALPPGKPFSDGEFAPGQLEKHFRKHADEWGAIGKDAYLHRARDLLGRQPGGEILGHTRSTGEIVRFNSRTGEFAVGAPDGKTIRTLFRPIKSPEAGSPLEYYLKDKVDTP